MADETKDQQKKNTKDHVWVKMTKEMTDNLVIAFEKTDATAIIKKMEALEANEKELRNPPVGGRGKIGNDKAFFIDDQAKVLFISQHINGDKYAGIDSTGKIHKKISFDEICNLCKLQPAIGKKKEF
jgi:hypothetical protein